MKEKPIKWQTIIRRIKDKRYKKTIYPELSLDALADGFAEIEKLNKRVAKILLDTNSFSYIRRKHSRNIFDPVTDNEKLFLGIMGFLWGAEVHVSRTVPKNTICFFSDEKNKPSAYILKYNLRGDKRNAIIKNLLEKKTEIEDDFGRLKRKFEEFSRMMEKISSL